MAFDLLHHLMNVAVQHRDGPETFEMGKRAGAVVRAPPPLRVHRPQRDVREDDNWRAALQVFDVLLEPFQLIVAERTKSTGFEIDDVDEADEVYAP